MRAVTADEVARRGASMARQAALGHRLSDQATEPRPKESARDADNACRVALPLCRSRSPCRCRGCSGGRHATKIERVVSPGGIEAWLVQDATVPLIALEFAFRGGAAQDPADKPGVANMTAALLDEGAGELDAKAFQERSERDAIELAFSPTAIMSAARLRTLTEHRDEAFDLLRLALTAPRFDADAVERIARARCWRSCSARAPSPSRSPARRGGQTAFPDHPYGRPTSGTLESVARASPPTTCAPMCARVLARDNLKIASSAISTPATAGADARPDLRRPAGEGESHAGSDRCAGRSRTAARWSSSNVPQSVVMFGGAGLPRNDPDFMAAFIVNHILGGGSFTSRLYHEVREKRGLAYGSTRISIRCELCGAALWAGRRRAPTQTDESIDVIEARDPPDGGARARPRKNSPRRRPISRAPTRSASTPPSKIAGAACADPARQISASTISTAAIA